MMAMGIEYTPKEEHQFLGEMFFSFKNNEGSYFIEHPVWSSLGVGNTLKEAEKDLIEDIRVSREHYLDYPDEELTANAKNFKYWLKTLRGIE